MMPDIGDSMKALAKGAAQASKREYPRSCPHRGEIIAMIADADLPAGLRLKQWDCRFWGRGVTWKDCKALSDRYRCHECAPGRKSGQA